MGLLALVDVIGDVDPAAPVVVKSIAMVYVLIIALVVVKLLVRLIADPLV